MTLSQRAGARFFVAFYRWSRYTRSPVQRNFAGRYCRHNVQYRSHLNDVRRFSCAPLRCLQEEEDVEAKDKTMPELVVRHEQDQFEEERYTDPCAGNAHIELSELGNDQGKTSDVNQVVLQNAENQISSSLGDISPVLSTFHDTDPVGLSQSVRQLMRHVTSPVAIITTSFREPTTKMLMPLGMAISSLNTVSLDPPYISFNAKTNSKTLSSIRSKFGAGHFRVHLLNSNPRAAEIVKSFTKGNTIQALEERLRVARIVLRESQAPRIVDPTLVAALECSLVAAHKYADHYLVVAKVTSISSRSKLEPTLTYVDGEYGINSVATQRRSLYKHFKRIGDLTGVDSSKSKTRFTPENHPFWSFPLFPGKAEQQVYLDRLKEYLEQNPQLYHSKGQALDTVKDCIRVTISALGVSLKALVDQVATQAGFWNSDFVDSQTLPLKYEFYGRLTPADKVHIIGNVRALVKADPRIISMGRKYFYSAISVDPLSIGLLPSEMLEPLRKEELLPPFVPLSDIVRLLEANKLFHSSPGLQAFEQIEYQVKKYLQTKQYNDVVDLPTEKLAENAFALAPQGLSKKPWITSFLHVNRAQLQVDCFPEQFDATKVDISGQVTDEEARVVIRRVFQYLQYGKGEGVFEALRPAWWEILRRIRVHPNISGIDPLFLLGKFKHFVGCRNDEHRRKAWVSRTLKPWLSKENVTTLELETLVDEFVKKAPLHAINWNHGDVMAALGFGHRARMKHQPPPCENDLQQGLIIPKILNAALRKHYGPGTQNEIADVVEYLADLDAEGLNIKRDNPRLHERLTDVIGDQYADKNTDGRVDDVVFRKVALTDGTFGPDGPFEPLRGTDSPSVVRKEIHALSSEERMEAFMSEGEQKGLLHKHVNLGENLKNIEVKSHGFKPYGLDGEEKKDG